MITLFALAAAVQVLVAAPVWTSEEWSILGALDDIPQSEIGKFLVLVVVFFMGPACVATAAALRLLWGTFAHSRGVPLSVVVLVALLAVASAGVGARIAFNLWGS